MSGLELPEIETLKRDLERDAVGRKIKTADVRSLKSLPEHRTKKSFSSLVEGAKIDAVTREGLFILCTLNNEHTLVIGLGTGGSLQRCTSKTAVESKTAVIITFTQGGDLRVIDTDGSCAVTAVLTEELDTVLPPAEERGLDLLASPISWVDFSYFVRSKSEPLRLMLVDQSSFVGIGDIYADEILFDAGLRYDRVASELTTMEVRRLHRSLVGVLHDAIKYRGTSLEDRPFIDLNGAPGEFADHLAVYGKNGDLSPRNRQPIQKAQFKGNTVYFCGTQV